MQIPKLISSIHNAATNTGGRCSTHIRGIGYELPQEDVLVAVE
jgi:hypothetical protein